MFAGRPRTSRNSDSASLHGSKRGKLTKNQSLPLRLTCGRTVPSISQQEEAARRAEAARAPRSAHSCATVDIESRPAETRHRSFTQAERQLQRSCPAVGLGTGTTGE